MITAVYLSNQTIQVVLGTQGAKSGKVKSAYEIQAPENSIINGVITAPEELSACLSSLWKEKRLPKKNVHLILNSTQFSTRAFVLPDLRPKKMYQNIEREFSASNQGEALYGYFQLPAKQGKGMTQVFASMMEVSLLDSYTKLFAGIGVELTSVEAALGCTVNLLSRMKQLKGKLSVVQILDGHNLTSILLEDGKYIYSSMNRLFNERGSADFAREVARSISGIIQFASAQKLEKAISDIYWAGFTAEEQNGYAAYIEEMAEHLKLHELKKEGLISTGSFSGRFSDWIFSMSALLVTQKEYNQLTYSKKMSESSQKVQTTLILLRPVIVVAIICMVVYLGLYIRYWRIHEERMSAENYNTNPQVVQQVGEYSLLNEENILNQAQLTSLNRAKDNLASYPYVNSSVEDVIRDSCNALGDKVEAEIMDFSVSSGIVRLSVSGTDSDTMYQLINLLNSHTYFSSVTYNGYTQLESEKKWTTTFECKLSAAAGK